ncbi:NAD(P)-binding protein [Actinomyces sp.]|uniref:NAD(P)-binding protein n=1 Tax=Actinomyces sp. TaxID=29317 RepID=UPI00289E1362|nr:NAD(P)-binding protein [Actinomyces sp.]
MTTPHRTPDDTHVWQVVVIGAGQAGLATAHDLVGRGLVPGEDFLVLDAGEGPGGAWRERWDSLTLGRAHTIASLPGMPMGPVDPAVPASQVVADYHRRYEERFALGVLRPATVLSVTSTDLAAPALLGGTARRGQPDIDEGDPAAPAGPDAPGAGDGARAPVTEGLADEEDRAPVPRDTLLSLHVEAGGGRRHLLSRMVISATGTWSRPYIPWVPGAPEFRGRQLHTVDYGRAQDFAGMTVLVVGGGLSAVQFLLELAPVASTVWATRRPPNFTDVSFDQVWGAEVERAVDRLTAAGEPPASVVRTTGIPREPAYLRGIADGILVSRGMFDRIGPLGVRFSPAATSQDPAGLGPATPTGAGLVEPDSWRPFARPTWVDADVIFWNTGFRAATGHLSPLRLREPGSRGIHMDGRVSVARDPRVLLVGYGSSASTLGATRAGREAARVALSRLTGSSRRGARS